MGRWCMRGKIETLYQGEYHGDHALSTHGNTLVGAIQGTAHHSGTPARQPPQPAATVPA